MEEKVSWQDAIKFCFCLVTGDKHLCRQSRVNADEQFKRGIRKYMEGLRTEKRKLSFIQRKST